MPTIPSIIDMLKSGVHLGHKKSRRHPKMDEYIFTTRGTITIIDLEKTQKHLEKALEVLKNTAAQGKTILFIGTKRQARDLVEKHATSCGMPYVTNRWIGGTLTNFQIIYKMIKNFRSLKSKRDSGALEKYTKKEQLDFKRQIEEYETLIGGIESLDAVPDLVCLLDLKKDKTAYREAKRIKVPIVSICDTNINPDGVTYPIPANDDAIKSLDMILGLMAASVNEGKKMYVPPAKPEPKKKEEKKTEAKSDNKGKAPATKKAEAKEETK